jgi:NAD(P)-dependent dehydrogenase (short-subunit alcohol dehydrogenase family)
LSVADAIAKLACLTIAIEFDLRYGDKGIHFNAVHPGVVATRILRDPLGVATSIVGPAAGLYLAPVMAIAKRVRDFLLAYTPQRAAITVLFAAASPIIQQGQVRGQYIVPEGVLWVADHPALYNETQLVGLWDFSTELAGPMPAGWDSEVEQSNTLTE